MNGSCRIAIVAIALSTGMPVAVPADDVASPTGLNDSSAQPARPMTRANPNDNLVLNPRQQKEAWQDIGNHATRQKAPAGFTADAGDVLPSQLEAHPMPASTADKLPILRPYRYTMLESNELLIVNPSTQTIASVISR